VGELSPSHPRTRAITSSLLRGETPEDLEPSILDIAQGIGRELVGCGTIFVHDILTTPWNFSAAEALTRLEKGSRRPGIPGSPTRRWVVWANGLASAGTGPKQKKRPWSLVRSPLPLARYIAPSLVRRKIIAKALGLAERNIEIIPGGIDVGASLGLTENVQALVDDAGLLDADAILYSPSIVTTEGSLVQGLDIVKALTRAKRGLVVRWLVTGHPDPRDGSSSDSLAKFLFRRDKLGLSDSVRVLSAECEWARSGVAEEDLSAIHRLADAVMLAGGDDVSGIAALEGALTGSLVILVATSSLKELVKGEKGIVSLSASAQPALAAKRILSALASAPAAGLRKRARQALSWDAIARDFLVPLAEGAKTKRR
jgi:glycosyltransferase involved in cell wall biosynthesis